MIVLKDAKIAEMFKIRGDNFLVEQLTTYARVCVCVLCKNVPTTIDLLVWMLLIWNVQVVGRVTHTHTHMHVKPSVVLSIFNSQRMS